MDEKKDLIAKPTTSSEYVAPEIESVVSAQDLEREVQYAGFQSGAR